MIRTSNLAEASTTPPSKRLPLHMNFGWMLSSNLVYATCQWGVLVVLAKLSSAEMVGRFALGLAVTAPVLLLTNMQLRTIQATDVRRQFDFSDYVRLRLITTTVALIAT